MALTKEQLLGATCKEVEVEGFGTAHLRQPHLGALTDFENAQRAAGLDEGAKSLVGTEHLIAASLCNADGSLMLTPEEARRLPYSVTNALLPAVVKAAGMDAQDAEAVLGNSGATQGD